MDPRERKLSKGTSSHWGGRERGEPVLLRKEGDVTEMRLAGRLRVN